MSKALFMAAAAGAGAVAPTYVDDVFSTYLYTGNGGSQSINNGIDLAGQGGLVWIKSRFGADSHFLVDSARSLSSYLVTNSTATAATNADGVTALNANGFSVGPSAPTNTGTANFSSWTFRKAPKFFDVVTFTANGSPNQRISHGLSIAPGSVFVKSLNFSDSWYVYHASLGRSAFLLLNGAGAIFPIADSWGSADPTSSDFGVSNNLLVSGQQYVAYLFAHDTATDGLIQCGSFTTNGSGAATVTLGWEPQFLIVKDVNNSGDWYTFDTMRAWTVAGQSSAILVPNTSGAESSSNIQSAIRTDGFSVDDRFASANNIYIAIRRPNKPPTVGTQVFAPLARTGTGSTATVGGFGFPLDSVWGKTRASAAGDAVIDRLRGGDPSLSMTGTSGESSGTGIELDRMDGYVVTNGYNPFNASGSTTGNFGFKRAPGFFDVVCDTGTGSAHTVAHNLGVVPELILRKGRSGATDWQVYCANLANTEKLVLNSDAAKATDTAAWNSTTPTASVFTVGTGANVNTSTATYISYLFATLAGISKVGSYTGNGSSQTINCGFTTGARFVLIKRANSSGDWFVWDTARGIVSGNDPHLSLNTTVAEVTTNDTIDPTSTGFIVNQVAATNVNVNAATYIYLAIA